MARRRAPGLVEQLQICSDDLDRLLRRAGGGPLHAREYHECEGEAQRIARALVVAFRGEGG